MTRDFIAGVIAGVVIALIWAGLNRPKPTPPRKGRVIDIFETDEFQEATG